MAENNWFISEETKKLKLSKDSWVEYKVSISYDDFMKIFEEANPNDAMGAMKIAKPLLKLSLVGWNLKDRKGKSVEFSKENIEKLSAQAIMAMAVPIITEYQAEKKSLA